MVIKIDKRDRAHLFRERLQAAMAQADVNQSQLARRAGVDRSTLSQLLKDKGARLPNAQLVAECAAVLGVSADWLLGLSDRPEQAADLVATAISMTEAPRAMVDDQIFAWHQEAAGYKIRHVPAGLPDMLKTVDMLRWEYAPSIGKKIMDSIVEADSPLVQLALIDMVLRNGDQQQLDQLLALAEAGKLYPDLSRHVLTSLKRDVA